MNLKYVWAALTIFLGFGFLPEKIPDYSDNYNQTNNLLVERQECGCPCANAVIVKGEIQLSDSLKRAFPELNEKEISLINFSAFDNVAENYNFIFDNKFKVTGKVIGIDTIFCQPSNCEVVPKFKVDSWTLPNYYPKFWRFNPVVTAIYLLTWIIGLPMLAIVTAMNFLRKRKNNQ